MDFDQLETKFLVAVGKLEIPSTPADLILEVTFDAGTLSVNLAYRVKGGGTNSLSFQRTVG